MSSLLLQYVPEFLDFSPADDQHTCIFPLARAHFRRCSNPVNKKDLRFSLAPRDEIRAMDPFESGIEAYLDNYAQLCCCTRYHRAQMGNPHFLKQVCQRWKEQLRSQHTLGRHKSFSTTAVHTDDLPVITDDKVNRPEELLPRDASNSHIPQRKSRVGSPDTLDELPVVGKRVPTSPQDRHSSAAGAADGDDNCLIRNKRTGKVAQQPAESPSQEHQRKSQPFDPAGIPPRTIVTRSQTGSLPWSFSPRRRPAEETMVKALTEPISEYSSHVGVIYLFTRISDPGFVKLGCTNRDPRIRLKEWKRSCGYKPTLLHTSAPVPDVRRVESLLKKELSLQGRGRQETYCKHNKHCPKNHTEWFEVSLTDAVSLVDAWTSWMRETSPYQCVVKAACRNSPVALIREEWRRHFESLSHQKIEIRSHCLLLPMNTLKIALEPQSSPAVDVPRNAQVFSKQASRKPLVPVSADTARSGEPLRLRPRTRYESPEGSWSSSNGILEVDHDLLTAKVAAVVALASSTLPRPVGADDHATLSTLAASSRKDVTVGVGGHENYLPDLERTLVPQITAYC